MFISKSKVYELALSSVKEEHVNDFSQKYIPNVLPIMAQYGGKFLISGIIRNSMEQRFPAKSFALLEWPSIGIFTAIGRDERMLPLLEARNRYLEFILEGCFYHVPEDIDFLIPENRTMSLLLSDKSVPDEPPIRFRWINDKQNTRLASNLYFSNDLSQPYDSTVDIEKLIIQVR